MRAFSFFFFSSNSPFLFLLYCFQLNVYDQSRSPRNQKCTNKLLLTFFLLFWFFSQEFSYGNELNGLKSVTFDIFMFFFFVKAETLQWNENGDHFQRCHRFVVFSKIISQTKIELIVHIIMKKCNVIDP